MPTAAGSRPTLRTQAKYNNTLCRVPNAETSHYFALLMAQLYRAASDDRTQTLLARAYLRTGCAGSSNPLFSGNGITYTGDSWLHASCLSTPVVVWFVLPPQHAQDCPGSTARRLTQLMQGVHTCCVCGR